MTSNPGTEAAGQTALSSAQLQQALSNIALPALTDVLSTQVSDLGTPGQEPDSVSKAFGEARQSIQQDYQSSNERGTAAIKQEALQSGMPYNPQAVSATVSQLGSQLEQQRAQSQRALSFQEAQVGQNQTNQMLNSINQGAGSLLSGSLRFGQNSLGADQTLSQIYAQNQQQGTAIGGLIGAAIGTVAYPGIGTALGGAAGGVVGGLVG